MSLVQWKQADSRIESIFRYAVQKEAPRTFKYNGNWYDVQRFGNRLMLYHHQGSLIGVRRLPFEPTRRV